MKCDTIRPSEGLQIHIPPEQRDKLLDFCCEIEPDFFCFEENYIPIAETVPKKYRIIDLGCYMAAQAFLFKEHAAYVGVDCFDVPTGKRDEIYCPPRRFNTDNSIMLSMTIQEFVRKFELFGWDKNDCYVICSGVPDFKATAEAMRFFPNAACFYPGQDSVVKGCFKEQILSARCEFRDEQQRQNFKGENHNV